MSLGLLKLRQDLVMLKLQKGLLDLKHRKASIQAHCSMAEDPAPSTATQISSNQVPVVDEINATYSVTEYAADVVVISAGPAPQDSNPPAVEPLSDLPLDPPPTAETGSTSLYQSHSILSESMHFNPLWSTAHTVG